jgi:hypothetical protein
VAILGIESLIYGVDDLAQCTKFFDDFGLPLVSSNDSSSKFVLPEGSKVELRPLTAGPYSCNSESPYGFDAVKTAWVGDHRIRDQISDQIAERL